LQDLRRYRGGETAGLVNRYVQRMFKPLLWAHYGFEDRFKVEYTSSLDEEHYTKILSGITSEEYDSLSQKTKNIKQKPAYWTFQSIPDEKIGILDLNSFASEKDLKAFKKFLKLTFTTIHDEGLTNLIIDLRRNGGGDHTLGEALIDYLAREPWVLMSRAEVRLSPQMKRDLIPWFLRWMPIKPAIKAFAFLFSSTGIANVDIVSDSNNVDLLTVYTKPKKLKKNPLRFIGNTFVLIDNGSYSMSVMFAAVMKDYHFATLIGEETGQSANPYGANYFFSLPNTQLRASVSMARSYRPSGEDTDRGVIPDFEVRQNQEDLEKGVDTVMEFTKQLIRKHA
jgi:C-terminal processing protease CtpA/Prc